MDKLMIIGPVVTDIVSYVKTLPRGNEEMQVEDYEQRIGGMGYHTALMMSLFRFPYELLSDCGSGVYGTAAYDACVQEGLEVKQNNPGIAGCTYHIVDPEGNYQYYCVPGTEYDFDPDIMQEIDPKQFSAIALCGDMFCGEGADDLMEMLREVELPLYFQCGMRIDEAGEAALSSLYALNPVLLLNEADALFLIGKEEGIDTAAEKLHARTQAPVIILKNGEGAYYYDGSESYIAPFAEHTESEIYFAAFLAARTAGVDYKNALVFAGGCMTLDETEESLQRQREQLAAMIMQKQAYV